MKKLVYMFVAVAAISFASCGNQAKPAQEAVEEELEEVTEAVATAEDSAAALALVEGVDSLKKDSVFTAKLDSIVKAKVAETAETAVEADAEAEKAE